MRKGKLWWLAGLATVLLLSGCSRKMASEPQAAARGEKQHSGSMLAYEQQLQLLLPAAAIPARLDAAREACEAARFGACNVLRLEQDDTHASLSLRIVPDGVEPLVKLAAQGGEVSRRTVSAEDLADAVNDNHRQQALLQAQQQRMAELAARRDIGVSDLIALGKEQAELESQLQAAEREAAAQQHRLNTNLVTLDFMPIGADSRASRLRISFAELLDHFVEGVADALNTLGYGLPFLIIAFPLLLLWRWLWRKMVNRRRLGDKT
jgi:Domain of unknown function (DUF4349)